MTERDIADYLQDIFDAADAAIGFVEGMSFEEFEADTKTIYAVTRAIQIIGEAVKKIPDSVKAKYPDIPWKDIARMRDKVTHQYFGVKLNVLWDTVKQDLPILKDLMQKIGSSLDNNV